MTIPIVLDVIRNLSGPPARPGAGERTLPRPGHHRSRDISDHSPASTAGADSSADPDSSGYRRGYTIAPWRGTNLVRTEKPRRHNPGDRCTPASFGQTRRWASTHSPEPWRRFSDGPAPEAILRSGRFPRGFPKPPESARRVWSAGRPSPWLASHPG